MGFGFGGSCLIVLSVMLGWFKLIGFQLLEKFRAAVAYLSSFFLRLTHTNFNCEKESKLI